MFACCILYNLELISTWIYKAKLNATMMLNTVHTTNAHIKIIGKSGSRLGCSVACPYVATADHLNSSTVGNKTNVRFVADAFEVGNLGGAWGMLKSMK